MQTNKNETAALDTTVDTVKLRLQLAALDAKIHSPTISPANRLLLTKLRNRIATVLPPTAPEGDTNETNKESNNHNVSIPDTAESNDSSSELDTEPVSNEPEITPEIVYNAEQQLAIDYAVAGKSLIITGAAGTGKTTVLKGIVSGIIKSGRCGVIGKTDHKYLHAGTPGIVILSYTNKAVQNVKKRLPHDLHKNCMTSHKFLEYQPFFEEVEDKETGKLKTTRVFAETRDASNPNPESIRIIGIDEATMSDVPLFNKIMASMPKRTNPDLQLILMGDIQQLPPVFGKSIFIHALQRKMLTVELTQVYRQALENPILALAHRILSGKIIPKPELEQWNIDKLADGYGKLTIIPWKKKLSDVQCNVFLRKYLPKLIDSGEFNPAEDVILCPFNVNIGTELINSIVASHTAKKLGLPVYEIYTGTKKVFLRVGDRVLHNKSEATVTDIKPNFQYFGKTPRKPSSTMDYDGIEHDRVKAMGGDTEADNSLAYTGENVHDYVDRMLDTMGGHTDDDNPAKRAASHIVTVVSADTGDEAKLSAAGEINQLLLAYAITVHKSQGSEYRKVIFLTHHTHSVMMQREIMYVAVTRAKEELVVICEPNAFVQGITSQKIPGATLEQKIEGFERVLRLEGRKGGGNKEQIPVGLGRFIEELVEEELNGTEN